MVEMEASTELRLAAATPNVEGSVAAIARAASREGVLRRFYTTLYGPNTSTYLPRRARDRLAKDIERRSFRGIEHGSVQALGGTTELLRIAAMRVPRAQPLASRAMYETARRFDRMVARRLDPTEVNAVVAMFASANETMAAAQKRGILGVLNFISGYPSARNRLLIELGGLREGHHELIPARTQDGIERALDQADLVLVASQFVARQLTDAGVPADKIALERYGVDLTRFTTPQVDGADKPHDGRPLRCLFVGQIGHIKGIPVLVEAARRLSDRPVEISLVGPLVTPDVLHDLPSNVSYHGKMAHAAVAEMMAQADVFVLPSLVDVFPLVVIEAMASGLPVVVSDSTGASEIVDSESGFVVPVGNAAALAEALENLLDDPELRRRMSVSARGRANATSWESYGRNVVALIAGRVRSR